MAKRNKILISVLVAAVLALLIALCFVGNTFARYTLSQKETVTADIAEWGVSIDDSGLEDDGNAAHSVTVKGLKPNADKFEYATEKDADGNVTATYDYGETQRVNEAQFTQVAVLTNTGDVSATVTIAESSTVASSATYQDYDATKGAAYGVDGETQVDDDGKYVPGDDYGYGGSADITTGSEYASEIGKHIKADVYYSTTSGIESADDQNLIPLGDSDSGITLKSSKDEENETDPYTIYIYLDVEWISDLVDETNSNGDTTVYANGDGFDTWCGMWVKGFSFDITIEAFQAS